MSNHESKTTDPHPWYRGGCDALGPNGTCAECAKLAPSQTTKPDPIGVHMAHCYQGEYEDTCKYGDDDCPAKPSIDDALETIARARVVARILSDNGHHVTPPDEASLDDVEQARWDTCIEIAMALQKENVDV